MPTPPAASTTPSSKAPAWQGQSEPWPPLSSLSPSGGEGRVGGSRPQAPSTTHSPALWPPSAMHHRQHHNLISHHAEIDCVRKSAEKRPARLTMNARMSKRVCDDAREGLIDGLGESLPKASTLWFVPTARLEQFGFGLRTKDETRRHTPPASFRRTSSQGMAEPGFAICSARR